MSDLKISRRVVSGYENLLADAERVGEDIFGREPSGLVAEQESHTEVMTIGGVAAVPTRSTGKLRFNTYDNLLLPIVDIYADKQANLYPDFNYVASKLTSRQAKHRGRPVGPSRRGRSVYDEMNQAGLAYDISSEQQEIPVWCSALEYRVPPRGDRVELALRVDKDQPVYKFFVESHRICLGGIRHARGKVADLANQTFEGLIPVGEFPADASVKDRDQLQARLGPKVPLRLVLDGIEDPFLR